MTQGINIGKCRGVNIIDFTNAFDIDFFRRYTEEALTAVPEEHLQTVENINIYDECPSSVPVIARGGYSPPTSKKGADLDIYLDQNLCPILSEYRPKGKLTAFLDALFTRTFGKRFIIHTLFHELGHHVYHVTAALEAKDNDNASEEYAVKYANDIYNKMYPLQNRYYWLFNGLYHLLYSRGILKNNGIRNARKGV